MSPLIRYDKELTGIVSFRQTFWRRKMVLQVEERFTPLVPGTQEVDSTRMPHREWRDANWADISRLKLRGVEP